MSDIVFGSLQDLSPREAWAHEARAFTPWLAENIDRLSEVVGMPLEVTGTEMAVDTFAADILARNLADDTTVLIENQLEQTDHTHLGQIMTYLAGLDAKTVIWIAPSFRQPHLSAVKWLNEHTADGFSFFAVKLRVVRIGDSPYAPIFEIIEKPNDWDRELKEAARPAVQESSKQKFAFWSLMAERHPELKASGLIPRHVSNVPISVSQTPAILLSIYISKTTSGAFLRGPRGAPENYLHDLLGNQSERFSQLLRTPFATTEQTQVLLSTTPDGWSDPSSWSRIMDWMDQAIISYESAVREVLDGSS